MRIILPSTFLFIVLLSACSEGHTTRFRLLSVEESGVDFRNDLTANSQQNIFNYMYFYNGGGVGVGDLNGDGLPELYFSSNQGADQLYLNEGGLRFSNASALLGETAADWSTGVSMADINGDGRLDIYVSVASPISGDEQAANRLYLNESANGELRLREAAAEFGLDQTGYGTQAAFFDFDRDGDLDCYQLNHSVHSLGTFRRRSTFAGTRNSLAGDRLLRNDGQTFVDVSLEAGIKQMALGYGLGLSISDLNEDGWPDIYVGNDFHEDDYCYINQKDGTFKDELRRMFPHTSRFTMGTDIADLNNDGLPEVMTLDMLPADPVILKAAAAEDPYDIWHMKQDQGYWPQFSRNNLQYNLGIPPHDSLPYFGDRAIQAGVYATDWSWSVLLEDFDQDGQRDIFVANGILGRSNDMDYINYVTDGEIQSRLQDLVVDEEDLALANRMPKIKLPNPMFRNQANGQFEEVTTAWGFSPKTYSHGAAYGDLDGDGDLDLVLNNVNDPAHIWENQTQQLDSVEYLELRLEGEGSNPFAIGAKVEISQANGQTYLTEVQAVRGFQSSVDIGKLIIPVIEPLRDGQLTVHWPNGEVESFGNFSAGSRILKQGSSTATAASTSPIAVTSPRLNLAELGINYRHEENQYVDFNREGLIPHMVSRDGPAFAGFNLGTDWVVYLGGGKRQAGELYRVLPGFMFEKIEVPAFEKDALNEDVHALRIDVNWDYLDDLVVLSGGNEFPVDHEANDLRIYLQSEDGGLIRNNSLLEKPVRLTGSKMAYLERGAENSGLIVAGRTLVNNYGAAPTSYLLTWAEHETIKVQALDFDWEKLGSSGMIQDVAAYDFNHDGIDDVVIATEWGPLLLCYGNAEGLDEPVVLPGGNGFWSSLMIHDMDGDDDLDIIAGNLGNNSKLAADIDHPVKMYYDDFDSNGKAEQLITYTSSIGERLFATREEVIGQLPGLREIAPNYTGFAKAALTDLFTRAQLESAQQYHVDQTQSIWLEQTEAGEFVMRELPAEIQSSPIELILPGVDNYCFFFGSSIGANIQRGHYDAAYGWALNYDFFQGKSQDVKPLFVSGRIRSAITFPWQDEAGIQHEDIILGRNNDRPLLLNFAPNDN